MLAVTCEFGDVDRETKTHIVQRCSSHKLPFFFIRCFTVVLILQKGAGVRPQKDPVSTLQYLLIPFRRLVSLSTFSVFRNSKPS